LLRSSYTTNWDTTGATREEILETLGMAIYMGAGPSAMYASHALGAYAQFAAAKAGAPAA
jgi:alkylhydroperoxidase/carboxymuconolactone decarboxylase family protein YurZ